ncbi:HBL088Cp [Eremothecium sinecaudum]|uniref:HBL088Cp n=1 Tax=Eremothecium sinecaudum TaxID=45286 RepID=A0A120K0Y1_9SACH|nr:HBL088Cp [Eremothecium sinecaudum]AMD18814.1 HBL088Cp [Eremothecium sinecaudum]
MSCELTPVQEHYLKRELLRLELADEFDLFNDKSALRRFGYPFAGTATSIKRPEKHFKDFLPSFLVKSGKIKDPVDDEFMYVETEFPLLSNFLQTVIMSCPLLSRELARSNIFWQQNVQQFFEDFMELPFSSSYDREELTKRKRTATKLSKVVLLFYNSGIGTSLERRYYDEMAEGSSLVPVEREGMVLNTYVAPTEAQITSYVTKEPRYINGVDLNVITVFKRKLLLASEDLATSIENHGSWFNFSFGSNFTSNLLSKFSINDKDGKNEYLFLIKMRRQAEAGKTLYLCRTYRDFKILFNNLIAEFPGKKIPKVPEESNVDTYITDQFCSTIGETSISTASDNGGSPSSGLHNSNMIKLKRENMRTSLRQYLRTISQDKEIATSTSYKDFLSQNYIEEQLLPEEVRLDIRYRDLMDITNLKNQLKFQKIAIEKSIKLQDSLASLKDSILKDQNYLLVLFRELKEKEHVEELSTPLRNLFDWCKVYLSATIYQTFIGNDNGYEAYETIKRLHRLMPYTLMSTLLEFTNPMSVMKGFLNLFLASSFGHHSLVQTLFSNVIDVDVKNQKEEIAALLPVIATESCYGPDISEVLRKCIFENEGGQYLNLDVANENSRTRDLPTILVIVEMCVEKKLLPSTAFEELFLSYQTWRNVSLDVESGVDNASVHSSHWLYYCHVRSLFQLYIRKRDKELLGHLWEETELPRLIKSVVLLFYEPFVKMFKVARMDLALNSFRRFMEELIKFLDSAYSGKDGIVTSANIVEKIENLVDSHENVLYKFLHEVYNKDKDHLFEDIVSWSCDTLGILQKSKWGLEEERIDLMTLLSLHEDIIDTELLKEQLNQLIDQKLQARKLYNELTELKAKEDIPNKVNNIQQVIDQKWKTMNKMVIPEDISRLGIDNSELVALDLDVKDFQDLEEGQKEMREEYQAVLAMDVDTSEIKKFNQLVFKDTLRDFLKV